MGLFNRNKKEKKPELLEFTSNPSLQYMPLIGLYNSPKDNYMADLQNYAIMEKDAIIKGALELWAADATQPSIDTGHSVWIECNNPSLKEELDKFLYEILDTDNKAFSVAYRIARDGQYYLRTSDTTKNWCFEPVNRDKLIYPIIEDGVITKYYAEDEEGKGYIYPDTEFVPFLSIVDEDYETLKLRIGESDEEYKTLHGDSFLKGSVIAWRVLTTIEEILLTARVGKTSVYNLVRIEVGNASKKEADKLIEEAKKVFKTQEAIDLVSGMYKSVNSPIGANENIYIPTRGGVGNIEVESVGGNYELKEALDLEYFKNKLFATLQTPKAYLGFDGEATSVLGDNSLVRLDERYARRCKRLQAYVKRGYYLACKYYLERSGRNVATLPAFKVCMTGISSNEEKVRREEQAAKIENAKSVVDLATTAFANQINREKLFLYVFNNMIGIPTSEISNLSVTQVPVVNYGYRGTGIGNAPGRKYITVTTRQRQEQEGSPVLDNYNLYLSMENKAIPLNEAAKKYKPRLNELTAKQLKDMAQSTDPARVAKAKRLTTTYIGLNKAGDLMFKTSSGTTPGKVWYQTIRLLDLPKAIELFKDDGSITDRDIVSLAIQGDLGVYCNDPSFKYWGWQWMATAGDYGIVPENRAPEVRNPELRGSVCKHLLVVLRVMPFWTNQIVGDLRKQFFKDRPEGTKAKDKQEYEPGIKKTPMRREEYDNSQEDTGESESEE